MTQVGASMCTGGGKNKHLLLIIKKNTNNYCTDSKNYFYKTYHKDGNKDYTQGNSLHIVNVCKNPQYLHIGLPSLHSLQSRFLCHIISALTWLNKSLAPRYV